MQRFKRFLTASLFFIQLSPSIVSADVTPFTFEELNRTLTDVRIQPDAHPARDYTWNEEDHVGFRKMVLSSLNQGIASLFEGVLAETPIVEIGSGSAYELPSNRVIRLQPDEIGFRKLRQFPNTFQMSVLQFVQAISTEPEKRVPFYFALNVFDTMPAAERLSNVEALARTQSPGDTLLIASDVHPFVATTLEEIGEEHPNTVIYPYFTLPGEEVGRFYSMSAVIVPKALARRHGLPSEISPSEFADMVVNEVNMRTRMGLMTGVSVKLAKLRNSENLEVVLFEDFYSAKLKRLLENHYTVQVFYHTTFSLADARDIKRQAPGLVQPIVYKSIFDWHGNLRQWSLSDQKFLDRLESKGLSLPQGHTEESLARGEKKLLGAEFLVIKAIRKAD